MEVIFRPKLYLALCVLGWSLFPAWLRQLEKRVIHSGFWSLNLGDRHSSTFESASFSVSAQRKRNGGSTSAAQLGGFFFFPFAVEVLWSSSNWQRSADQVSWSAKSKQRHSASTLCSLSAAIRVTPGSGQRRVGLKQPRPAAFLRVLARQRQYLGRYRSEICFGADSSHVFPGGIYPAAGSGTRWSGSRKDEEKRCPPNFPSSRARAPRCSLSWCSGAAGARHRKELNGPGGPEGLLRGWASTIKKLAVMPEVCLAQEEGKNVLVLRTVIRDSSLVVGFPKRLRCCGFVGFPSV